MIRTTYLQPSAAALVVVLLLLAGIGAATTPAAAAPTHVAIRDVTTGVENPAPGEAFTVDATVANLQTSSGPVNVTEVVVRRAGTDRRLARITEVGTIAPGSTLTIPLTVRLTERGGQRLTVTAVVEDEDGETTTVRHPLFVRVERPDDAAIAVAGLDPVAGQTDTVDVTVANGVNDALFNLGLSLAGDATVENADRVAATLQPGAERTYEYRVTFPSPGERLLTVNLTYRTSSGYTRTVERALDVTVEPATVDGDLTAAVVTRNGSADIRATLTGYGNVDLRDGDVRVVAGGTTVARGLLSDVPAEESRSVTVDGDDVPAGTVTVVTTFTAAGEQRRIERELQYAPGPAAAITIAGVDASRVGDRLTVRGNATNVGSASASAVLLSVVDAAGVTPVAPHRDAFVGTVGPSGRGAFELTAAVAEDVTAVPVRVAYTVDGEQFVETRRLDVRDAPERSALISLTGVEFSERDGVLAISGDAANVGTVDARSVVVSVDDADGVTPVTPRREYFVGAVDASEFATFELTANVSADVDAVPVRVAFTVDGERLTDVVSVPLPDATARGGDRGGGGGLPLLGVVVGILVGALLATVYHRRWR